MIVKVQQKVLTTFEDEVTSGRTGTGSGGGGGGGANGVIFLTQEMSNG